MNFHLRRVQIQRNAAFNGLHLNLIIMCVENLGDKHIYLAKVLHLVNPKQGLYFAIDRPSNCLLLSVGHRIKVCSRNTSLQLYILT